MGIMVVLLSIVLINVLLDAYIVKQLKSSKYRGYLKPYCIIAVLSVLLILIAILFPITNFSGEGLLYFMWLAFVFWTIFLPKLVFVVFSLVGKIASLLGCKVLNYIFNIFGTFLSVTVFCVLIYSAFVTAETPKVKNVTLEYENLPKAFDGFKIVQISDFHLGSFFADSKFVGNVVDEINAQHPDVILFTGDLVNSVMPEAVRFEGDLSRLKAKHGVWSILGNHDYGDYYKWKSIEEKDKNLQALKDLQARCGWRMLNNSHEKLYTENDSIVLIGVENWGDFPFPKYGDLRAAYKELNDTTFKILMSHNPVHWKNEVLNISNIDLMLAGHTHAMQCVIDLFGFRWSPAVLRYEEWGGLYSVGNRNLYVNSGLGYVGVPARIGVNPEITLITLKKKENVEN